MSRSPATVPGEAHAQLAAKALQFFIAVQLAIVANFDVHLGESALELPV
jgi:hypothetical protein